MLASMRLTIIPALACLALVASLPALSWARRVARGHERAAIAAAAGIAYPARCSHIYVATVDRRWALYSPDSPPKGCPTFAGNGIVLLNRTAGRWRLVFSDSDDINACAGRPIPRRMARDLRCLANRLPLG
jgi:hypothetical protein